MSDFKAEWGVASPWGCTPAESREVAEGIANNMREGGHEVGIIWRGVTEWHHDMTDERAMQPVEPGFEWGTGGADGYVSLEDSERDARVDAKLSNRELFKRTAPGPWVNVP